MAADVVSDRDYTSDHELHVDIHGQELGREKGVFRQILSVWRTWVVLITPLVLLPIPILYPSRAGKCAYAVLIMAAYWMTEAIPMAATALLPVVLMPWLGVLGAKDIYHNYLKDTNMLFFGGLLVAVAVERWNLHKRIALRVLLMVGSQPRWLMFGFMTTTAFLSMWISNTATTAMMIPIAHAVLTQLDSHRKSSIEDGLDTTDETRLAFDVIEDDYWKDNVTKLEIDEGEGDRDKKASKEDMAFENMSKGITLCVAYAANIGGTGTLIGTGPNMVLKGMIDTLYGSGTGINFSSWFIYSFPNMLITLFVAWVWLQLLFLGPRELCGCCCKGKFAFNKAATKVIRNEYEKLGKLSFAEVAVLCHFILLAILWLTREPEFIPGWAIFFPEGYVTDACVAITIAVALFIFPSRMPNILCFRKKGDISEPGPVPALLNWEIVHQKVPWGVIFVVGGGFALAKACQESGLSNSIGKAFVGFTSFPVWALVLILCVITAGFTEVTSNAAIATIFLPIFAEMGESIGVNPLYLTLPTTVATSFAFMLPVATPPNAIVFAYGNIKIYDMAKAGIVMNILSIMVLTLTINTWGLKYFHLDTFPAWANDTIAAQGANRQNITAILLHNCTTLSGKPSIRNASGYVSGIG